MLRLLLVGVLSALASPAMADFCYFTGEGGLLYITPSTVTLDTADGRLPVACSLSSAGTGVTERIAACTDGRDGRLVWKDDTHIVFRDEVWEEACN